MPSGVDTSAGSEIQVPNFDNSAAVSAYPIIELARIGGALAFKGWDNGSGYVTMGLPTGFATGAWQTLKIDLLPQEDRA